MVDLKIRGFEDFPVEGTVLNPVLTKSFLGRIALGLSGRYGPKQCEQYPTGHISGMEIYFMNFD